MANIIKLRKGLDINLQGKPNYETMLTSGSDKKFALVPDGFVGVVPKVIVKEGDTVLAGDILFVDKKHDLW